MAAKQRSFWSSLPGLLTGLAGVLTGVVGLLGFAFSQGWIGEGTAEDSGSGTGDEVVRIDVDLPALSFTKAPTQEAVESVAIANEGTGPITVSAAVEGEDAEAFTADDSDCGGELPPGRSCSVAVRFDAGPGVSTYGATLVVEANAGEQSEEVELTGRSILG